MRLPCFDTKFEEGKIEGKIEVAKELIKKGISVDVIIEVTGLSKSQIEKIEK
jgi:predicted transposase/invertase (TIGR01784 family)